MRKFRKVLGSTALVVIAVEVVLVLGGVVDFSSAAEFTILMELFLAVFVLFEIFIIVTTVRTAKAAGKDLPFALDEALAEFFPRFVARYARQDLMLVRAIWMLLTGQRDVGDTEVAIGYSGPLVFMMSALTVLDGLAAFLLHLLLPAGIRTIALILGVIGLVWLVGFLASLICYPHVVGADRVRFRFSAFQDVSVPTTAITHVQVFDRDPDSTHAAARIGDQLIMAVGGQANLTIELDEIEDLTTLSPKLAGDPVRHVTFYANERREALRVLQKSIVG